MQGQRIPVRHVCGRRKLGRDEDHTQRNDLGPETARDFRCCGKHTGGP